MEVKVQGLGLEAQGVVLAVRNHDVAGRIHRDAGWAFAARMGALAVLKARLLDLVPRDENEPAVVSSCSVSLLVLTRRVQSASTNRP